MKRMAVACKMAQVTVMVSRHNDGRYYASVLYPQSASVAELGVMSELDMKSFISESQDEAVDKAMAWIRANIDPEATI
jgi:hypothetical protein